MNVQPDPLARLRAERAAEQRAQERRAEDAALRRQAAQDFGFRLALERLTWQEVEAYRQMRPGGSQWPPRSFPSHGQYVIPQAGAVVSNVSSADEWFAFLDGVDAAARAVEARR